jgi:glycosyltransferase involved in cell wall biosynthesis
MVRSTPLGSIVIPAHNEESVIAACLEPLAPAIADGRLEVVVVPNACTDRTAEIARSFDGVRVLELKEGGKPGALRAGETVVRALPRIYLDADVVLPLSSVLILLEALAPADGSAGAPAARPPVRYESGESAALVRRYYRARAQLPAVLGSLWGAGVYALSEAGRARFDQFPDLVADDLWVDQLFAPGEVKIIDCEPVTVAVPRNVSSLLTVLRRTYRGKSEFHEAADGAARETAHDTASDVRALARRGPSGLVDAATYTGMVVTARVASKLARRRTGWERDNSSRVVPSN